MHAHTHAWSHLLAGTRFRRFHSFIHSLSFILISPSERAWPYHSGQVDCQRDWGKEETIASPLKSASPALGSVRYLTIHRKDNKWLNQSPSSDSLLLEHYPYTFQGHGARETSFLVTEDKRTTLWLRREFGSNGTVCIITGGFIFLQTKPNGVTIQMKVLDE